MPGTWGVVAFVLAYKLCERAEQTFSLFQVDKGVPRATMALWSTVARTASLLGSTYGGYVLFGRDARGLVVKFCWLRTVTIAAQVRISENVLLLSHLLSEILKSSRVS